MALNIRVKLLVLSCLLLSLVAFWWFFPTRSIVILGKFKWLDQAVIHGEIQKEITSGFFRVNLFKMRDSLLTVNGIEGVKIWRYWPGDIIVSIKARNPEFQYYSGGVIDKYGVLFYPHGKVNNLNTLPVIESSLDKIKISVKKFNDLKSVLKPKYTIIKLINDSDIGIKIILKNNIVLMLGQKNIKVKLKKLMNQLHKLSFKKNIIIDLRYLNGFAVKKLT